MSRTSKIVLVLLATLSSPLMGYVIARNVTPPASDVARIERWAAKQACVGTLDAWQRGYSFPEGERGFFPDFDTIHISFADLGLSEPDGTPRRAGVRLEPPPAPWRGIWADDRQQRIAWGQFDRESGKVVKWSCGCNFGSGER